MNSAVALGQHEQLSAAPDGHDERRGKKDLLHNLTPAVSLSKNRADFVLRWIARVAATEVT